MNCKTDNTGSGKTPFTQALMQEITGLLEKFVLTGAEGMIDLRGLPMAEKDRKQLEELLGNGEVTATIRVAGETQIRETSLSGVWWVRHKGAGDQIISEQIVVTQVPEIIKTHKMDAKAALGQLQAGFYREKNSEQGDVIS